MRPYADAETLMRQAAHTADYYLSRALHTCKEMEVKPHPVLLAAYLQVCAADFDSSIRDIREEKKMDLQRDLTE